MIKSLFLALALLVGGPALAADITKPFDATVQLSTGCSGTIIQSDRDEESGDVETIVLTAKHCVRKDGDPVNVMIWNYDDESRQISQVVHKAKVRGQWFKGDLALVELIDKDNLFKNTIKVADKKFTPKKLEEVTAIGYPMTFEKTVMRGDFIARLSIQQAPIQDEMFATTVKVAGGSSGGGLYAIINDEYQLIGVTSMGAQAYPWSFFVPTDQIRAYIDIALK